ncbi:hypothetical protein AB0K00_12080 [Dactylosporangium sp. NPDC049525]|uniref:hypothetical protein n=1 Tax=Dactylosporangium sp. NPDC049525 TaxID=3154730 RepID=UPI003424CFE0
MARHETSNRICGTKTVNGTPVVFGLGSGYQVNGRDAYLASITYEGLGQPSNECEAAGPG